jgi:tRNA threonylcarbamoyladenosine biosynthesis protein TsaB
MEFYMLVLALDTTTRQGSIALLRDGAVMTTFSGDAAITHGERLPGDLARVLDSHALPLADVDLFAVASGPGSFTGLRIGIATMQGLALAQAKPLVGISALDALNELVQSSSPQPSTLSPPSSALSPDSEVSTWMDAQRGQVFSATYVNGVTIESAIVEKPAEILSRWQRDGKHPRVFAGDGALVYRDLIRRAERNARIIEPLLPLAPAVARLAEKHLRQHGPLSPDAIRPVYIRRSDAELARDRKADPEVGTATAKDGKRAQTVRGADL